jgi:hypothetical protein
MPGIKAMWQINHSTAIPDGWDIRNNMVADQVLWELNLN